jgi:hypothetical protein
MEYQLQINEPKTGPNKGDIILEITDVMLHSTLKETKSVGKIIDRSIEQNQPGRIYSKIETNNLSNENTDNNKIQFLNMVKEDPNMIAMLQKYNQQGKRVFFHFPKEGVPIFAGKDTKEFMKSKNGKRIIRGIAKNK